MLENLALGLQNVFEWQALIAMIIGVAAGIIIGALPGLNVTMAIALMLPFTFGLSPVVSMLLLIGVYCGGTFGGSISAILLRTPGTPASAATVVDGFALSQKGKANRALNISIHASVFGGLFSGLILLFLGPQVAKFALRFGPPEYFMLAVFGLTLIAGISGTSIRKGLVMAALGLFITTIGLDPIEGVTRFTFNTSFLLSGIDLIPAMIGLFAIAEVFKQIEKGAASIASTRLDKEKFSIREMFVHKVTMLKSSIIGAIVGIIPGTGAAIASFLAYSEAQRSSKKPDEFGKGSEEGVAAAESANNATTGTTLIPMMSLGIPGDTVTAVLLGALLIQGLSPGPQLFTEHAQITYTVMVGFVIVNLILFLQAKYAIRWFTKVVNIPNQILLPIVAGLCLVGSYATSNTMGSVVVALVFGVIGYILPKYGYPVVPMLIAIILGPIAERSLKQSLVMSDGSLLIFLTRPISIIFIALTILSLVSFMLIRRRAKSVGQAING